MPTQFTFELGVNAGNLLKNKSIHIGTADNEYTGAATSSTKHLGKSQDPEKIQTAVLSETRVATDKFFFGNENMFPDIKDVSTIHC